MSNSILGQNGAYDEDYLEHLRRLSEGDARVEALLAYKNDSYGLNGSLKAGTPGFALQVCNLQRAIRAVSTSEFTVYRMTSVHDFAVKLVPYLENQIVVYPAFVSASRSPSFIEKFSPSFGPALVLEIEVPPGFPFALMEVSGFSGEDEILIPCGTNFVVTSGPTQAGTEEEPRYNLSLRATLPHSAFSAVDDDEFFKQES